MTANWTGFGWQSRTLPNQPPDEETRERLDLPRTLLPVAGDDVSQRSVFDPAMKHHRNAYRAADPGFTDPARSAAWRGARREALHTVLAAIAASEWADALVLRGSVLLSVWFGDAAREPGDLDFVVVPPAWKIDEPRTGRMLEGIAETAERTARDREIGISAHGAVTEDIWTYERVPGRRLMLPWSAPGLPGGHVQLDFVFNEKLPQEPEPVELGGGTTWWAVSPELSLAWKVLWLINDTYAQGKDLYDAVLLARRHPLRYELLHEVFRLSGEWPYPYRENILFEDLEEAVGYVEWRHFAAEYPQFADDEQVYAERLLKALAPTFDPSAGGHG